MNASSTRSQVGGRYFLLGLTFIGSSLAAPSAHATITPTYSDLILGFRVITLYADDGTPLPSQGIGAETNLVVNLGQASQFYNPTAGTFTLTGLSTRDLAATYGADWNTRTDLAWGIIGTTGTVSGTGDGHAPKSTIWATIAEATPGIPSLIPQYRLPASLQNGPISKNISPLFVGTAPFNGAVSTANSATAAAIGAAVQGSWSTLSLDNGSFGLTSSIEGTTDISTSSRSVLDLYELQPSSSKTAGTLLGTFSLSSGGTLTFTANLDSDGDGLADAWELQFFGNITSQNGSGDPDGDGQTNAEEQLCGTSPVNSADFFLLSGASRNPTGFSFSFTSIPSRSYHILYSTDLAAASWLEIAIIPGGAEVATVAYQDTDPTRLANPKGFYKVAVSNP